MNVEQQQEITLEATVIRADGTVEDLGEIASSRDGTISDAVYRRVRSLLSKRQNERTWSA
jgi:hypothetical protein